MLLARPPLTGGLNPAKIFEDLIQECCGVCFVSFYSQSLTELLYVFFRILNPLRKIQSAFLFDRFFVKGKVLLPLDI